MALNNHAWHFIHAVNPMLRLSSAELQKCARHVVLRASNMAVKPITSASCFLGYQNKPSSFFSGRGRQGEHHWHIKLTCCVSCEHYQTHSIRGYKIQLTLQIYLKQEHFDCFLLIYSRFVQRGIAFSYSTMLLKLIWPGSWYLVRGTFKQNSASNNKWATATNLTVSQYSHIWLE